MTLEWKDLARGGRLRAVTPLPFFPLLRGESQSSPRPQDPDGRGKHGQPARASVCVFRGAVPCVLTHRLWSVRTWWHLLKPWAESSEVDTRTHNHSPSSPVYSPGSTVLSNTVSVFALWKTEAGGGGLFQVQDPHAGLCTPQAPSIFLEQTRTVRDPNSGPSLLPFAVGSLLTGPRWVPPASPGCLLAALGVPGLVDVSPHLPPSSHDHLPCVCVSKSPSFKDVSLH